MSSRTQAPLSRFGIAAGFAAALLFSAEPLLAQGPPAGRPPSVRPPHGHDRSNIPPKARPEHPLGHDRSNIPPKAHPEHPLGHDRSNVPPRANPDPPGKGDPHGPSQPKGPNKSIASGVMSVGGLDGGIAIALRKGELSAPSGRSIPLGSQQEVLNLVAGAKSAPNRPVARGLAPLENSQARGQAARLASDLHGLLAKPEGLQKAVVSYNALVDASSESFLRNPSGEFLAVQSVLALLVEDAFAPAVER